MTMQYQIILISCSYTRIVRISIGQYKYYIYIYIYIANSIMNVIRVANRTAI